MNKLYLLRHGLTRGNLERLYYGSTDLPLCEEGLRQLNALREQGGYPSPEGLLIVTSGMLRTEQTLAAIYGDIAHERWPELREMDFGAFEMKRYEQLKDRADYQSWLSGDMAENHTPGGESEREVFARVLAALARLQAQPRDVLAVVHGGTAVAIMSALFPNEGKNRYEWQPKPGFGYEIDMKNLQYRMIPE